MKSSPPNARLLTEQAFIAAVDLMVAPRLRFCATGAKAGNGVEDGIKGS